MRQSVDASTAGRNAPYVEDEHLIDIGRTEMSMSPQDP